MLDSDTIIRYLNKTMPVTIGLERRIRFVDESYRSPCEKILGDPGKLTNSAVRASSVPIAIVLTILSLMVSRWEN